MTEQQTGILIQAGQEFYVNLKIHKMMRPGFFLQFLMLDRLHRETTSFQLKKKRNGSDFSIQPRDNTEVFYAL